MYVEGLLRRALGEGLKYVHTSSSYAERNHERMLGAALKDLARDSFVLGTSPDLPYRFSSDGNSMDDGVDLDPDVIGRSMDGSLERLGLDHVDIYYLASVGTRRTALHEPYIEAFEALKRRGLTRFIGLITHSNEPEVIQAAVDSGRWDVVVTAYNSGSRTAQAVAAAVAAAVNAGLGVVKTQAGVYWDRLRLRKINMKAALKWVVQDEHVHTTIPAFSSYDELREDLDVIRNPALTPAERSDLRLGETAGLTGVFCQQCGECVPQCPSGANVTVLMRAAMYATADSRPGRAQRLLRGCSPYDIPCTACARCRVRCRLGLDIRSAACDLMPLLATERDRRHSVRRPESHGMVVSTDGRSRRVCARPLHTASGTSCSRQRHRGAAPVSSMTARANRSPWIVYWSAASRTMSSTTVPCWWRTWQGRSGGALNGISISTLPAVPKMVTRW
jgi:predicted aldo/keto reductase-like oxidoreductase